MTELNFFGILVGQKKQHKDSWPLNLKGITFYTKWLTEKLD